jgi:hypothetical protein
MIVSFYLHFSGLVGGKWAGLGNIRVLVWLDAFLGALWTLLFFGYNADVYFIFILFYQGLGLRVAIRTFFWRVHMWEAFVRDINFSSSVQQSMCASLDIALVKFFSGHVEQLW